MLLDRDCEDCQSHSRKEIHHCDSRRKKGDGIEGLEVDLRVSAVSVADGGECESEVTRKVNNETRLSQTKRETITLYEVEFQHP